jgi:hypothetical protein
MNDNITFNGMLGMLQKGEVDLCIHRIAKSMAREKVADFLLPITKVSTLIIV